MTAASVSGRNSRRLHVVPVNDSNIEPVELVAVFVTDAQLTTYID